jgi:NAD(P)-dependent dehydrogenase (short-subunit alcohol dehydrogenase family)
MNTIVMTGGTAGIGLAALQHIRHAPDVRLLVGARAQAPAGVDSLPLDLTRLASVRSFAAGVEEWLGEASLDGLVLNAGMQTGDVRQRTEDGFETTFAVNHLAHYLLLRLLMPRLAPEAIVVITTSNLHDPRTNPVAPPEHADAGQLARGQVELRKSQGSRSGMRAYAASKLCNVLTARALASSALAQQRKLRVIAFNPGFAPGTRLTRNQPLAFKIPFAVIVPILGLIRPMNTLAGSGGLLADLALGRIAPPAGRLYASQIKRHLIWPDISELASDDAVMAKLWRDSAALVCLPGGARRGPSEPDGRSGAVPLTRGCAPAARVHAGFSTLHGSPDDVSHTLVVERLTRKPAAIKERADQRRDQRR